jgi:hypothetical protein
MHNQENKDANISSDIEFKIIAFNNKCFGGTCIYQQNNLQCN